MLLLWFYNGISSKIKKFYLSYDFLDSLITLSPPFLIRQLNFQISTAYPYLGLSLTRNRRYPLFEKILADSLNHIRPYSILKVLDSLNHSESYPIPKVLDFSPPSWFLSQHCFLYQNNGLMYKTISRLITLIMDTKRISAHLISSCTDMFW